MVLLTNLSSKGFTFRDILDFLHLRSLNRRDLGHVLTQPPGVVETSNLAEKNRNMHIYIGVTDQLKLSEVRALILEI